LRRRRDRRWKHVVERIRSRRCWSATLRAVLVKASGARRGADEVRLTDGLEHADAQLVSFVERGDTITVPYAVGLSATSAQYTG
jgi:hypothetical protein